MSEEEMVTEAESSDAPASEEENPLTEEEVEETEEEEQVEDTEDSDADSEAAEDVEEKTSAEQKKLAELSYKLREQKRQNARILRLLEQQEERQQKANAPQPPKLEDFETIDDFVDAKVSYALNQGKQPEASEPDQSADFADFEVAREDMIANGVAKHPDFEDVVLAENVDITLPMANALVEIDDTDLQVDTAYYLGSNPKEAGRIAKLSPVRQIAEVAKISTKIAAKRQKPVKQPSKAPKPIKPVGGSKTRSNEIEPDDDMATFIKKRNKQLGRA